MSKPLVSVVLPTYNVEQYLQKCMNSLYAQTYEKLELIIVDDGSNDACATLCDEIGAQDSRVVVYHKENGGLSDARNYGIHHAKGEYISCIDPDDYVDIDYIEYLYNLIEKFGTRMSVCQHRVIFPQKVKDYGNECEAEILSAKKCIERMLYHDVIDTSAWAKLYHKSLFEHIEYPVGKYYEDIATTHKLFEASENIAVGYESKYNYIVRRDSIVNRGFSKSKLDLIDMTDEMASNIKTIYPELENAALVRQLYARFSTLNQMIGVKGVKEKRRDIIDYIMDNGHILCSDNRVMKRDKIAYLLLRINYLTYEMAWKIYEKIARN